MHAAIEIVDLALDVALPQRRRHGQNPLLASGANRGRSDQIRHRAKLVFIDEARQPLENDGAIDVVRRARRQQARREQIALARRNQVRPVEDVHVLIDDLADPDHHVILGFLSTIRPAAEESVRLFDDALRDRRRARRFALNILAQEIGEVGADHQRQYQYRNDRGEDERQEQLAVKARANLTQQCAPDTRTLAAHPGEDRRAQEREDERGARQRTDLRQVHEVIEEPENRIADGVDTRSIVREVDAIGVAGKRDPLPERLAVRDRRCAGRVAR